MDGAHPEGVERRSLWQDFLLDAGTSPDQHPAPLFGKPVVDRIFEGARVWHWRQFAWPTLSATALWLGVAGWAAWQSGKTMLALSSSVIAALAVAGAVHVWNTHHKLPSSDLHLLAINPEQSRWLVRLDAYLKRIVDGTIRVFDGKSGEPLDGSYFSGNNGRILVLDSCYDRTDRARRYGPVWGRHKVIDAPVVFAETKSEIAEFKPPETDEKVPLLLTDKEPAAPQPNLAPEAPTLPRKDEDPDSDGRKLHHYLHGVMRRDFNLALTDYLAAMPWSKDRKNEFRFVLRTVYALVQDDPYPRQKDLLKSVRDRVARNRNIQLNKADETVRKIIGNVRKKDGSDFMTFVIARQIQPPFEALAKIGTGRRDRGKPGNTG